MAFNRSSVRSRPVPPEIFRNTVKLGRTCLAVSLFRKTKNKSRKKFLAAQIQNRLEAAGGFEPPYNGFADRRLTTWLSRPLFVTYRKILIDSMSRPERFQNSASPSAGNLELHRCRAISKGQLSVRSAGTVANCGAIDGAVQPS